MLWNWKPVASLLPGRAGVSDLDGVIERNGYFLFMEGKHPHESLSTGQRIMLQALAGLDEEKIRVVIVYGDRASGNIESYQRVYPDCIGPKQPGKTFHKVTQRWFQKATESRYSTSKLTQ